MRYKTGIGREIYWSLTAAYMQLADLLLAMLAVIVALPQSFLGVRNTLSLGNFDVDRQKS
jgi:hypothetical protein